MKNRFKRRSLKIFGSIFVILLCIAGLSGCGAPKETAADMGNNKNTSTSAAATSSNASNNDLQGAKDETSNTISKSGVEDNSVDYYVNLLGLSKDKLTATLNEKPVSIDEGGLEFKKAGIRVWFDNASANQIFTQRKDIDICGAKIGDKIDKFVEKLGKPVSDKNGDMHFKYKDVFLSINYDTGTRSTFALYILKKDFK